MKVLIVGAKGMLGQALCEVFQAGHEVRAWDRGDIDITKQEDLRFKLKDLGPDSVINAAAYNNVDGAESEPEIANSVNGYAVGYLAEVCRELDIPLVHYSTEYVFDGENQKGYREDDKPSPISKYGASKLLGEQELLKHTTRFYLIRLSRLFGKEAATKGAKKSFVRLMLDLARTRDELAVIDEELSCPTYAPDLAARTRELVEQQYSPGIYHSPNSGAVTWYGFAREIFKIAGISVKLEPVPAAHFPRPAKRPRYGILLNTKLSPMRPWQEALREFLIPNS